MACLARTRALTLIELPAVVAGAASFHLSGKNAVKVL